MNIRKTRGLRYIRRFNFHLCNKYESVAEHSFYVALIALELSRDLGFQSGMSKNVMFHALLHDITESVIGDIGFLVRREIPRSIKDLERKAMIELNFKTDLITPIERTIVDFADAYELKLYLEEERKSGNSHLWDIECETYSRLYNMSISESPCPSNNNWTTILSLWLQKLETVPMKNIIDKMTHEGGVK